MKEQQWKDIVENGKQIGFVPSICTLTGCCIGCIAYVYDCVMKGWSEHKKILNENIRAVGRCVVNWYNRWCFDYEVASMADIFWAINSGSSFDQNLFRSSYLNFCYDVGILTDALIYEKQDIETLVWYVVCDYIDIVSMFMSQEEFYSLMMDSEKEDEDEV